MEANWAVIEFAVLIKFGSYIVTMEPMDSRDKYSLMKTLFMEQLEEF